MTGLKKTIVYMFIAVHISAKYLFRVPLLKYPLFLKRALILLLNFRHHKIVRTAMGLKLDLYLPAYPSPAFFYALDNKLLKPDPAPVSVVFSMTKACPHKCPHCYQRKDEGKDLDLGKLIRTLLEVRDTGVSLFNIEGGEPFIHFDRLLSMLKALDNRSEIWVNTIGSFVDREKLEALKEAGLLGLMVSIHSPDAERHNAFIGDDGAFETACRTVKWAKELGLSITINSVLAEDEIRGGGLDRLMRLAKDMNADYVQLIHPKPSGMWLEKKAEMQKEAGVIKLVENLHLFYNSGAMKDFPALASQVFEERKEGLACTSGAVDRFYINATGEVQPCEFLNLSFGNVNEEDFDIIYKRMRSCFKHPASDWLCCTQAGAIHETIRKYGLTSTPVPWKHAREIVESWNRGEKTAFYERLGIYGK